MKKYLITLLLFVSLFIPMTVRAITINEYCMEPQETEFIRLLNQYRIQNGVPPVRADQVLGAAAEHHAIDMGQRNVLDHNMADGSSFGDNIIAHGWTYNSWLGEDAAGSREFASDVLLAFQNSPGHNAILLDPKYIGAGIGRYDDGGVTQARYWWVLDVASDFQQVAVVCNTPTATSAPSSTVSNTPISTSVSTNTNTPVNTSVPTNTSIPTNTPTKTSTPLPTRTPTPKLCPTRNPHYPHC